MKKTTKGALAAGTAAVILLGGAGSLAYWTASGTANGGSITSGNLNITAGTCNGWSYAPGFAGGSGAVKLFVPGDVVTQNCTFTISASGDNLSAAVSAPTTLPFSVATGSTGTGASLKITDTATYAISGGTNPRTIANGGLITSADNTGTLTATFVATIPYGTDETGTPKVNANDTQKVTAALAALTVTLTQANPNP